MAECDRSSIDIDHGPIDLEHVGRPQRDGRKCLVDLDQIEVGHAERGPLQGNSQGFRGSFMKRCVRTGDLRI